MNLLQSIKQFFSARNSERLCVLFFIMLCVFYLTVRIALIFSTNTEILNGETNNVWNILHVLDGRSLYMNPEEVPYEIFQYTPIAQLSYVGIAKLFGIENYLEIFMYVRAFVFLVNILLAIFIYKVLRKYFDISKNLSMWLSFLSLLLLTPQNWIIRPDGIATSLSVISVGLSIIGLMKKKNKYFIFSGIVTAISFFAKQDAIQLFVILPIALFFIQEYKSIFLYMSSLLISFATLFAMFYFMFGDIFLQSIFGGLNNGISIVSIFSVFNRYIQIYAVFPFILITLSIYSIIKQDTQIKTYISLVIIGAFIFAAISSLKLGAWINYYTLPSLLGIFLFALYVKKISNILIAKYVYLLFGFYFFTGIVFHFASAGFEFSKQKFSETQEIAEKALTLTEPKSLIYTSDKNLQLHLYKSTIFPNQEYYGVSPFKYSKTQTILNRLFIIHESPKNDYVLESILKFKNENLKIIDTFDNLILYKHVESN